MIAIDTNVLVRFLTRDDTIQHAKAEELLRKETVFIPDTVFLETEWVLRFSYGYQSDAVSFSFRKLLGLPNVTVTDPRLLSRAIEWYETGLDFADALHLSASHECTSLATFDTAFIKKARKLTGCSVTKP